MGNSDSLSSQLYVDPTLTSNLIESDQQCQIYQNVQGEQFQKYIVPNLGTHNFQNEYYYRLQHPSQQLVNTLYAGPIQNAFGCTERSRYQVVTERIPSRFGDLISVRPENSISMLKNSLEGFSQLYKVHGLMSVKENMIGLNSRNAVKVWLNSHFALNQPEPLSVSLSSLNPSEHEGEMVNNIFDLINSKTEHSPLWNELMQVRQQYRPDTFESAISTVEAYARNKNLDLRSELKDPFNKLNFINTNSASEISGNPIPKERENSIIAPLLNNAINSEIPHSSQLRDHTPPKIIKKQTPIYRLDQTDGMSGVRKPSPFRSITHEIPQPMRCMPPQVHFQQYQQPGIPMNERRFLHMENPIQMRQKRLHEVQVRPMSQDNTTFRVIQSPSFKEIPVEMATPQLTFQRPINFQSFQPVSATIQQPSFPQINPSHQTSFIPVLNENMKISHQYSSKPTIKFAHNISQRPIIFNQQTYLPRDVSPSPPPRFEKVVTRSETQSYREHPLRILPTPTTEAKRVTLQPEVVTSQIQGTQSLNVRQKNPPLQNHTFDQEQIGNYQQVKTENLHQNNMPTFSKISQEEGEIKGSNISKSSEKQLIVAEAEQSGRKSLQEEVSVHQSYELQGSDNHQNSSLQQLEEKDEVTPEIKVTIPSSNQIELVKNTSLSSSKGHGKQNPIRIENEDSQQKIKVQKTKTKAQQLAHYFSAALVDTKEIKRFNNISSSDVKNVSSVYKLSKNGHSDNNSPKNIQMQSKFKTVIQQQSKQSRAKITSSSVLKGGIEDSAFRRKNNLTYKQLRALLREDMQL